MLRRVVLRFHGQRCFVCMVFRHQIAGQPNMCGLLVFDRPRADLPHHLKGFHVDAFIERVDFFVSTVLGRSLVLVQLVLVKDGGDTHVPTRGDIHVPTQGQNCPYPRLDSEEVINVGVAVTGSRGLVLDMERADANQTGYRTVDGLGGDGQFAGKASPRRVGFASVVGVLGCEECVETEGLGRGSRHDPFGDYPKPSAF